jgi:hypothetical protein
MDRPVCERRGAKISGDNPPLAQECGFGGRKGRRSGTGPFPLRAGRGSIDPAQMLKVTSPKERGLVLAKPLVITIDVASARYIVI